MEIEFIVLQGFMMLTYQRSYLLNLTLSLYFLIQISTSSLVFVVNSTCFINQNTSNQRLQLFSRKFPNLDIILIFLN